METRKRKLTQIENTRKLIKQDNDFMDVTKLSRVIVDLIKEYLENLLEIYYYRLNRKTQKIVCTLGLIRIVNGKLISNQVINKFEFGFGHVCYINYQDDYIILIGWSGFAVYHIPTKFCKEYETKTTGYRIYSTFDDNNNLKMYRLEGLDKYNFDRKSFLPISYDYDGVFYSAQTNRGIYSFGRDYNLPFVQVNTIKGTNYVNDALFFDYKTEQITLLKPSPCGEAIPIIMNNDSIFLIASPRRKIPWKLGELPVYLYTPSKNCYTKLDFVIPKRIVQDAYIKYQNDTLYFINHSVNELVIHYLNQPFNENKLVGPITVKAKTRNIEIT